MAPRDQVGIGEAARRAGVSVAALRLYERRGLLPKAPRSLGGYRQYSEEDMRRARLVRRARRAGLTMRQIELAVAYSQDESALRKLLAAHLEHLRREGRRIARLQHHLCRWLGRKCGSDASPPERPSI
jgi:DNA-binding transcriptional MerR regulator